MKNENVISIKQYINIMFKLLSEPFDLEER